MFACDEEAYKTFSDLFGPIIKDLHPKFDFRYSYKYDDFKLDSFTAKLATMQEQMAIVKNFQIRVKRNFKGMPFTPLMTRESKLQIERKSIEVLGELYGSYKPINKIEPEDEEWLK